MFRKSLPDLPRQNAALSRQTYPTNYPTPATINCRGESPVSLTKLYISIVSQLAVPLGICFVLQQLGTLQPLHIWLAILAGHTTRCALSVLRFRQGRWRTIAVDIGR
jgi:hypothetical protein